MKLATFEVHTDLGPQTRVGVVDGSALLDVNAGYARVLADEGKSRPGDRADVIAPSDMLDFIRTGDDAIEAVREVLDAKFESDVCGPSGARIRYNHNEVRLRSPLPRPNFIRDYTVFEEHATDVEKPDVWYDIPVYFKTNHDTVVDPGADVHWPSWEEKLDFEFEVAAIIGEPGQNIDSDDALSHVFGFTIFNDFTARELLFREIEMPLGPAKSKDFANGFGPYIVPTEDFDAHSAEGRALVNGEEWTTATLSDMYHSWGEIIEHTSKDEPLQPGDVLGAGTFPDGCCMDQNRWIDPGDTIELQVDGIGTLSHRVVRSEEESQV